MLKRDYIMKLIQQLLDSLFLLLNEGDIDNVERERKLKGFYASYLGESSEFYYTSTTDIILNYLKEQYHDELLQRVEMLSDIMYADVMLKEKSELRNILLEKTLFFMQYLDTNSDTYSLIRKGKIDALLDEIKQN